MTWTLLDMALIQSVTTNFVLPVLILAAIIATVRLAKGPTLADRAIALDLLGAIGIGFIGSYALATGRMAYLDVAMVLALIAFLGSVAFATYLERRV